MNNTVKDLLFQIAGIKETPKGAYNLRLDGELDARTSSENIKITSKTDKPGIDIHIAPDTRNESVHIPVIITKSGMEEIVYNDFFIGENSDVNIVAGCGIHNCGPERSQHDGVHTFYVGKNAHVRYSEQHYGGGDGTGERILNPQTIIYLEAGAFLEVETVQIRGVDSTKRYTKVVAGAGSESLLTERLLTHGSQEAESKIELFLNEPDARARIISRSVAQDSSKQVFYPCIEGNAKCFGHVQCDSILMGEAKIMSIPAITANSVDAQLIHEAAIGRIAGEQILKLMTLGLTAQQAEEKILDGFLK
jgi:Fe-S cluster assembly scaffold protein SufB